MFAISRNGDRLFSHSLSAIPRLVSDQSCRADLVLSSCIKLTAGRPLFVALASLEGASRDSDERGRKILIGLCKLARRMNSDWGANPVSSHPDQSSLP